MALVSKVLGIAICIVTSLSLIIASTSTIKAQQVASAVQDDDTQTSAILDDLVNQIIEKNRHVNEVEALRSPRQVENLGEQTVPAQVPSANAHGTGDADLLADYQATSQELDDRHIQYDVVRTSGEAPILISSANPTEARLSNYKLAASSPSPAQVSSTQSDSVKDSEPAPEASLLAPRKIVKVSDQISHDALVKRSDSSSISSNSSELQQMQVSEEEKRVELAEPTQLPASPSTPAISVAQAEQAIEPASQSAQLSGKQVTSGLNNATARSLHLSARSLQSVSSTSGSSKPTPSHSRPPYASHDKFQPSGGDLIAASGAPQLPGESGLGEAPSSAESQLMQKLAPPSQLVELDPIPAGGGSGEQLDRFYLAKDRLSGSSLLSDGFIANRGGHNDRYSSQHTALPELSSHSGIFSSAASELQQQQVLAPHSVREQPEHRYAASFVNVTGPMLPPLSASEAMESALGGGQAAKSLLAQASGFARPTQLLEGTTRPAQVVQTHSAQSHHQVYPASQPGRHHTVAHHPHPYYLSSESPYSAPANQFSPRSPLRIPSLSITQENQLVEQNISSSASQQLLSNERERMRLESHFGLTGRRPTGTANSEGHAAHLLSTRENLTQQASGFRSPIQSSSDSSASSLSREWPSTSIPSSYLSGISSMLAANNAAANAQTLVTTSPTIFNATHLQQQQTRVPATSAPSTSSPMNTLTSSTTNGFITGVGQLASVAPSSSQSSTSGGSTAVSSSGANNLSDGPNRRVFNLTRVEHISAECSNDLIRTVIVFNGTFKGIIYSSGYVRDPNCMYINGTGKTRYDFSIRLNQCGTLGRQEVHQPAGPNEVSRQDKVMWNTLSIQYNPIIEQEWDEHFRVSCEYGSDFWKTVSFSPFNVETNTGSPVVFTVDPPQCQMEILRGHGMVGPRQDADSGAVTVGDPLTLLIHMKSEKAGYDILVKNCIAHNGGNQKMQLIDSNGCVVNERFISPFRGTYNDNDLKHVTLYSYLKAFRFTGSPVLYLECEIHMCQSKCPPQMCYWRRLSKRSTNETLLLGDDDNQLEENHENYYLPEDSEIPIENDGSQRADRYEVGTAEFDTAQNERARLKNNHRTGRQLLGEEQQTSTSAPKVSSSQPGRISDKVSLFQALKVLEPPREPNAAPYSLYSYSYNTSSPSQAGNLAGSDSPFAPMISLKEPTLMCYRQAQVLAFLLSTFSILFVALSVSLGCCWRAISSRRLMNRSSMCESGSILARHSLASGATSSSCNSSLVSSAASSPSANKQFSLSHYHQRPIQVHQYLKQQQHQQHSPYAMPGGSLISIADESQRNFHNPHQPTGTGINFILNSSNQKAPEAATLVDSLMISQPPSDRHKKRLLAANY